VNLSWCSLYCILYRKNKKETRRKCKRATCQTGDPPTNWRNVWSSQKHSPHKPRMNVVFSDTRHTTNFWARQDKRGRVGATGHTPPSKDSKLLQCHCHLSITHLHSHVHHPPSHTRWAPTTNPPGSEQHLPPPATCTRPPPPPHRSSPSNCYVADNVIFH
jgi:hypothetical protein